MDERQPLPPSETAGQQGAPSTAPASWVDLLLYLIAGPGVFFGAGFLANHLGGLKPSLLTTTISYTLNIVIFMGAVLVVGVWRKRLSMAEIGLYPVRWRWSWLLLAGIITAILIPIRGLIGLAVEILVYGNLEGLVEGQRMQTLIPGGFSWAAFLISIVMGGVLAPVAEELFFRGAIYTWFRARWGVPVAVVVSSMLFAAAHFDTLVVVVTAFIMGLVNALIFERTRSIWASIAVHAINNSLAFTLVYLALGLSSLFSRTVN